MLAGSYAGMRSVDGRVVDAARGMGMTSAPRLWQVELPGALALLLGGVRSAMLQVVATTTVAAYVGLGGLGGLVLDGLRSGPGGYPQMAAGALLIAGLSELQTAATLGLTSMEVLGSHCGKLTLGAAGEWSVRWKGKIAQVYGCTFREIRSTDPAGPVTLEALRSGQAQVVNLFTTSPDIAANRWVELTDPKRMYPAQRILPLVRAGALNQADIDALNRVSAALTTAKLTELNRRINQDRAVPADLAKVFVS